MTCQIILAAVYAISLLNVFIVVIKWMKQKAFLDINKLILWNAILVITSVAIDTTGH